MAFNSKWNTYKIVKITDLDGNERADARYSQNVGRMCLPNGVGEGEKFFMTFLDVKPDDDDRFFLGTARHIEKGKNTLTITTDNTVWYFKRVGGKGDDAEKEAETTDAADESAKTEEEDGNE